MRCDHTQLKSRIREVPPHRTLLVLRARSAHISLGSRPMKRFHVSRVPHFFGRASPRPPADLQTDSREGRARTSSTTCRLINNKQPNNNDWNLYSTTLLSSTFAPTYNGPKIRICPYNIQIRFYFQNLKPASYKRIDPCQPVHHTSSGSIAFRLGAHLIYRWSQPSSEPRVFWISSMCFNLTSPQNYKFLHFLRKMQTRVTGEDLSKNRDVLDRVLSHAFKLFVLNSGFFINMGGDETLAWNPEYLISLFSNLVIIYNGPSARQSAPVS